MKQIYSLALRAALEAGTEILKVYGGNEPELELKPDDSPLTLADRLAHARIASVLEPTGIPLLSEEGRDRPYAERRSWKQFWLVDPLDGTKEFLKRNGEFTVNIALIEDGVPVFGVVYAPVIETLFVGITGQGAWRCTQSRYFDQALDYLLQFAEALPLEGDGDKCFRVVASRSHYNEETAAFVKQLDHDGRPLVLVSKGSSLKLCMVATGEADAYPRLGPTMEWDTAAAHAVVRAAGKEVLQIETGEELSYNKESLLNPFFLVK